LRALLVSDQEEALLDKHSLQSPEICGLSPPKKELKVPNSINSLKSKEGFKLLRVHLPHRKNLKSNQANLTQRRKRGKKI